MGAYFRGTADKEKGFKGVVRRTASTSHLPPFLLRKLVNGCSFDLTFSVELRSSRSRVLGKATRIQFVNLLIDFAARTALPKVTGIIGYFKV